MNNDVLIISVLVIAIVNFVFLIFFLILTIEFFRLFKRINSLIKNFEYIYQNLKSTILDFIINLIKGGEL